MSTLVAVAFTSQQVPTSVFLFFSPFFFSSPLTPPPPTPPVSPELTAPDPLQPSIYVAITEIDGPARASHPAISERQTQALLVRESDAEENSVYSLKSGARTMGTATSARQKLGDHNGHSPPRSSSASRSSVALLITGMLLFCSCH